MPVKRWLYYALSLTLILLATIFSLMKWSDTYSNTHTKRTDFLTEPNTNVMKVDYILKNRHKYDSFIFGSSRVGAINPLKLKNGKYYNMTYSEGIPKEHLLNIKLFLEKGVAIKNLLIGLDDFSYKVSFALHQHRGLTKAHYLATKTNYLTYLKALYLRFPLGEDRSHMIKKLKGVQGFHLDISKQYESYKKAEAAFDYKKHFNETYKNNPIFLEPTLYEGNLIDQTIHDIADIVTLCKKNSINCIFFINPIHHTTYKYLDIKQLNKFKEKLAKITPYYDFTLPNKISNNNSYWSESSHYTLQVGDMIIHRIFDNNSSIKNFGIYIPQKKDSIKHAI